MRSESFLKLLVNHFFVKTIVNISTYFYIYFSTPKYNLHGNQLITVLPDIAPPIFGLKSYKTAKSRIDTIAVPHQVFKLYEKVKPLD